MKLSRPRLSAALTSTKRFNMSTPPEQSQINLLDTAYQKLSGCVFKGRGVLTGREESWHLFVQAGFTLKELETVILWLKRGIREEKRQPNCLRFSTLIGALDHFQEELSLAEAEARNFRPPPSHKEQFIHARIPITGPVSEKCSAVPIAQIAAEVMAKGFEEMRKAIR